MSMNYLQLDYYFFRLAFHMPLSLKVSLAKLQLDYYPYHLARGERKHWVRYPADSPHRAWLQVYLEYILRDTGWLSDYVKIPSKNKYQKSLRVPGILVVFWAEH